MTTDARTHDGLLSLPKSGETAFYKAKPSLFGEAASTFVTEPATVAVSRQGNECVLYYAEFDETGAVKSVEVTNFPPAILDEVVQGRASGRRSLVHAHPGKFAQTLMRDAALGLRTVYCLVLEEVTDQLARDGNRYFKVAFNKDLRLRPQIRMDRQLSEGMMDWQAACADQEQFDLYEEMMQLGEDEIAADLLKAMISENMRLA